MQRVAIIGAGNVGTTLGILFVRNGFTIQQIYSRTLASAERARRIIGQGDVESSIGALRDSDIYVIATNDDSITAVAEELAKNVAFAAGAIVFHCSGATQSSVLSIIRHRGAVVASVHPVKTFTAPVDDANSFAGTWCGVEGDAVALAVLEPIFTNIGAKTFRIDPAKKALYHSALVFTCNYLFSIIEVGLQSYEAAGVPSEIAMQAIKPILHATVENALTLGPANALTGPIARGDKDVIARQLSALAEFNPKYEELYRALGRIAVDLSQKKGVASSISLDQIRELLS